MSGSQDETGLGMDESPIPGPPASTPTSTPTSSPASSPASSGTRSPIIERSERSEPLIPDIQPHGSLAALTMCSVIFYLHQAGLHNPSPLTPRAESKVHTHASINPQPMAGSLAPSDLIMTEVSPSTAGPTWSSNGYGWSSEPIVRWIAYGYILRANDPTTNTLPLDVDPWLDLDLTSCPRQ